MKTEMKVLLYLKRNGQNEQGMCPLMGRISIKGRCNSTAQFSCKVKVNPKLWNATSQRCTGKSKVATTTNREIEKMLLLLRYRFEEMVEEGKTFSAEDLKNAFQGIASVQMTLLRLYRIHNEEFALRVGVNRSDSSYYQYTLKYRRLEEYIKTRKHVSDIPLKQLDMNFIEEYDLYMQKECRFKPATKLGHLKALSKLMNMAAYRGLVPSNPFKGFKTQKPEQKKRYLEMDELKKIMSVELTKPNCILTRDLFVFSAFTGICYCDMCNLKDSNLVQMADGTYWINTNRQKTGTPENVRLMDIPLAIVRKYKGMAEDGMMFPMLGDGSIRIHLRRIAEKCQFGHYFSFHQARHTFGTTICLSNGIPIETVSKVMGHRNINITQHYAKVTEKKIADDVSGLGSCLESKYSLTGISLPPSHILKDMSRRKPRPRKKQQSESFTPTTKEWEIHNMRSTFKQLFYINRQKIKKNGKCPIMGRITIDGKVSQYSTGYEIDPCLWNPSTVRAFAGGKILEVLTGEEKTSIKRLNMQLDALIEKGNEAYRQNVSGIGYVSAEVIKNALLEKDKQAETLLAFMADYNAEYESRIGIDKTFGTFKKYRTCLKLTREFINYKFDREDIAIKALERQFIEDFDFYLTTVRRMKDSTVNNHIVVMKLMTKLAARKKIIRHDPFAGYKYHVVKSNHRYLSIENLQKMMTLDLKTYRLCHTRDLFIFCCFTGIGRADLENLSQNEIVTKQDGTQWIHIARQKTKAECWIPLLDIPRQLIEKYKGEGKDGHLFFVPKACCIAQTFKILEKMGNFDQHLTFYMGRHTFATQICLSNDIPIETISKMLGHNQIRTTQIYAEITMQKQREDMQKLAEGVNGNFEFSTEDAAPVPCHQKRRKHNESTTNKEQEL